MRLQSLRIKGFKSFANDTIIPFEQNQIGIIGPNGSGKSNIVDSIRWVLGEQKSKELRLNKMSDVLFNGTKVRKQAGVCQVTLTFENTKNILPVEYNTVSVSRLLYRNGDSEYRLNNVKCRRKDILNLFIDAGIGSNSYSIIELAMVDSILQNKNNARRKMFEQGAGISKYKVRKHETQLKLNSTQLDLERLEDIVFELKNHMRSLERQAKRALKFNTYKEEYKEKSIIYTRFHIKDLETKYNASKEEISIQQEKYAGENTKLAMIEAELEKFKKDNLEKEQLVSGKQKEINDLFEVIRGKENEKNINLEKLHYNTESAKSLNKSIGAREERKTDLSNQLNEKRTQLEQLSQESAGILEEFEAAKANYEKLKAQYDIVKNDFEKNKALLLELTDESNELEKNLAIEQNKVSTFEKNLGFINENNSALGPKLQALATALTGLETVISELNNKEQVLLTQIAESVEHEKNLRIELEQHKAKLSNENRKLDQLQSEEGLLRNMIENLEGFPDSIKYLKKNWSGALAMLADIVSCDDAYRPAVEQFLEPYTNHFIVNNVTEAYEGLSLLKSAQRGKANFFLLEDIPNTNTSAQSHATDPAWTNLRSVITVDQRFDKLLDKLCENAYIVPESVFANNADRVDKTTVLISENGSILKRKSEMRGGSLGLFEGKKLGRKQRLEKVREQIKEKESEIKLLADKALDMQEKLAAIAIDSIRAELAEVQNTMGTERRALVKIETETQLQNTSFKESRDQENAIKESLVISYQNIEEYKAKLADLETQKSEIRNMPDKSEDEILGLEKRLSDSSEMFNEKQIQHIRHQGTEQNYKTEIDYLEKQIAENEQSREQEGEKLKENQEVVEVATKLIAELEEALVKDYEEKEEKQKLLNADEQEYYEVRDSIGKMENSIRELNRQQQALQIKINENKEQHHGYQLEMNGVAERLKIEFNISLEEVLASGEIQEDVDYAEMGERVEKLRHKISHYGEVNPMAVTAYEETKTRHDEIIVQREDIISAKESLLQTIVEIETDATEKFKDAFDRINANFKEVFRSLFSDDDDCELILLNPDSPLESEIEVIAKPKGKRPKSLSQLSGGEKTLTATALLFSLYLLKPAPFCILDEVDAPLDDANVLKFTKLINKFSDTSQFIIITHNKATMAALEVLYGVFMQEQGVSAMSPVDFRNYEYNPTLKVVHN